MSQKDERASRPWLPGTETPELAEYYNTCSVGDRARRHERVNLDTPHPWFCGYLFGGLPDIEMDGWNCMRAPGHSGQHLAEARGIIIATETQC